MGSNPGDAHARGYQSTDQGYLETECYEEEWKFSKSAKHWLIGGGVVISGLVLYLFCFTLPQMFIPESRSLHGIFQIQELNLTFLPVAAETVKSWGLSNSELEEADTFNGQISRDGLVAGEGDGDEHIEDFVEDSIEDSVDVVDPIHVTKKKEHDIQRERLVIVGDIHGQQKQLHKLLRKIKFHKKRDMLFVLGDFISKGPNSLGVIDDLIELDAKCILGNHEYYVLQNYALFHRLENPHFVNGTSHASVRQDVLRTKGFNQDPEFLLAKKLQPRHVEFINKCPIMMRLGPVPLHSSKNNGKSQYGQGLAVHAGVRWDLTEDLNLQDPQDCLEMRSLIGPDFTTPTDDSRQENAVSWSKIWNAKHKNGTVNDNYVVYYGHDAHRGLNLKKWAKGIDTGCTRGDSLSAMVLWQETSAKGRILYKEQAVSVKC